MFTDKAYFIKDRFREESNIGSVRTIYRPSAGSPIRDRESLADPGLYPDVSVHGIKTILNCPPGLEILGSLTKVYLTKRLDSTEHDLFGSYKGEIIDEVGARIFLLTDAVHYDSDEVIHYGKHKKLKMKGKICFGVINYAGIQVFEIYGDPEKVIRVGPNSAVWGEIQMVPHTFCDWAVLLSPFGCCCKPKNKNVPPTEEETEIQVVVLKKDFGEKNGPYHQHSPTFKHVYTLRGRVDHGGCCMINKESIVHRKSFNLRIYTNESLENPETIETTVVTASKLERDPQSKHVGKLVKHITKKKKVFFPKPIGRISSDDFHEKLNCYLPILEVPETMDVYDKITLMGTFFLFSLM